jgi:hypothetical protein
VRLSRSGDSSHRVPSGSELFSKSGSTHRAQSIRLRTHSTTAPSRSPCVGACVATRKINLCTAFSGHYVGAKEVDEKVWLTSFMQYDLGCFDHETSRLECADNPFEAKVLPMSSE